MNRLFIIGNGFDLAHGLPTSYSNYIANYWSSIDFHNWDDNFITLNVHDTLDLSNVTDFKSLKELITDKQIYPNVSQDMHGKSIFINDYRKHHLLTFKNDFFWLINEHISINKWVDIENLYYDILKQIALKKKKSILYYNSVETLNKEFQEVKDNFERYLHKEIIEKYDFNDKKSTRYHINFYDLLKPISRLNNESKIIQEFNDIQDRLELKSLFEKEVKEGRNNDNVSFFLNFNYTPTINKYLFHLSQESIATEICHIHGRINDLKNQINFGFGDEMDDDYKAIENINNNEYLSFFKSFQYFQNSNYSSLLNFVNSNKYQVCIMGHSSGLSDRTLLNTIFEHENCRSIKVYYYEWMSSENRINDNYTNIMQNISRHFNDKSLMRQKIVNKLLSKALPQTQIPLK